MLGCSYGAPGVVETVDEVLNRRSIRDPERSEPKGKELCLLKQSPNLRP